MARPTVSTYKQVLPLQDAHVAESAIRCCFWREVKLAQLRPEPPLDVHTVPWRSGGSVDKVLPLGRGGPLALENPLTLWHFHAGAVICNKHAD